MTRQQKMRAATDKWQRANPEKARASRRVAEQKRRLHVRGLSVADFYTMVVQQGGVCAICHRPETEVRGGRVLELSVDHNHETGKVRGLLCSKCNKGLGLFDDNADRLRAATAYRESYR